MVRWLQQTFSSEVGNFDVIQSRSLNITRITAIVVPTLTAISTALAAQSLGAPFNDQNFQRQLFLAMVGLVALVAVADIFGRAIARKRSGPVASFKSAVKALRTKKGSDDKGTVVALRVSSAGAIEYLFVHGSELSWEPEDRISLDN